jgi:dienelactone hydrolase
VPTQSESFVDFLDAYGREHPPSLRLTRDADVTEWRGRFREAVESLRGPLPKRVPLSTEIVASVEEADHTRHLLRVRVTDVSTLVAYLLIPNDIAAHEQRPGLIVSHGHAPYGMDSVCGVRGVDGGPDPDENARRAYALFAGRSGYVVLAPAWWGWAGRDGHLDKVGSRDRCNVIQMAAAMYGVNVTDLHIQDGQAAIDALCARPEVDAERIGCIGNSYGGRSTMWLAIFDERVRACVSAGAMNTFRERSLKLSSCAIQYLPGILRYGDTPELYSLIAPRPMQLQAGDGDGLITDEDRDHIDATVRRVYAALDASGSYDYQTHPSGHLLDWDLAAPFLAEHLNHGR